ncbi:MAG TPA: hypothetical protein DCQ31_13220 [Bacteroidales bacterium]|nr:hypothetical protein [Bacteroidales bacterium]
MTEKTKANRERLRQITKEAEHLAKLAGWNIEDYTKNALIMRFVYNPTGEREFKSFAGWIAENRSVKKGSKAFLLWSQPQSGLRRASGEAQGVEVATGPEEDTIFYLSFIFEKSQTSSATERPRREPKGTAPRPEPQEVTQVEEPAHMREAASLTFATLNENVFNL